MATSAAVTRLMENARSHLPGAVDDALRQELFNVMADFFKASKSWREDVVFNTIANTTSYELTTDAGGAIDTLMQVLDANNMSVGATMSEPGTLVLNVKPTSVFALTATVALSVDDPKDRESYPVYPSWVTTKYSTTIIDGLRARMMIQPAKPYTNQQLAIFHQRKFNAGVALARAEARHQHLYGGQTWRFPTNFARGSQR